MLNGAVAHLVRKEGDVGACDLLILGPSLHHGRVVDAVDVDVVDARLADLVACLLVSRHLVLGSGGREGARKADDDHLLIDDLDVAKQVNEPKKDGKPQTLKEKNGSGKGSKALKRKSSIKR